MHMTRTKPLSKMTHDELRAPDLRYAVMRRGRAIRRLVAGLPANAPLPDFSLEDAIDEILSLARDRSRGRAPRTNAARGGPALRQRMFRLRKLEPEGLTRDVWREVVDHFKGACYDDSCTRLACRVGRLPDGTPVPACVAHSVQEAGT